MTTVLHISDSSPEKVCNFCHMEGHPQAPDGVNPGGTMTGAPYLRGSGMGNLYEEDGAPWDKNYISQTVFGAVPRGETFTNAENIFAYSHGRPAPVAYDWDKGRPSDTSHYPVMVLDTPFIYQGETALAGGGYRGPDSNAGGYNPPPTLDQPYAFNSYDWGATSDAAVTDMMHHQFSCSKCNNPHALRLPMLMITNCLDIRHNTWDENNSSQQNTFTSSAQNCHCYDDSRATQQQKGGWNKITPWQNENINKTAHP